MIYFLGLISTVLLLSIAVIHLYWAFGGSWAIDSVFPTKENDPPHSSIKPPFYLTIFVAIILLGMGLCFAQNWCFFIGDFSDEKLRYVLGVIGAIFLIRAIGEFKYVGLFKSVQSTKFAEKDTKFYSPLCLFLAFSSFVLMVF
ncbi:DUF3995 domain-containing protein [Tenacibaculum sp. SG-28]|uniref:DUF3995 domain-containing protein n=1 Tax=Tenacibaculum sp. SG-28 TaxID=754426 RepID=UPI000CF39574|nr:DUF3995 domain-containing protein [Tenacibaculum sp. SG-28]PQJ23490.1 hypothetical protein BSU00_04765 [Tenacibaculum sp. SG-28]